MSVSPSTRHFTGQLQTPVLSLPNHENSSSKPSNTDTHTICSEVDAILNLFQLHRAGKLSKQQWQKFPLSQAGYRKLQEAIQQHNTSLHGYIEDKIRYDYFPYQHQLVIRMPSTIHEFLLRLIVKEILAQLDSIGAGQSSSADFARDIDDCGNADIKPLDLYYGKHSPDASFGHCNALLPGVILEVSYPQKQKDLLRLADDYLLGSNGNIQVVIGLDLEYRGSRAVFSVWKSATNIKLDGSRSIKVEQVVANENFRGPIINTSVGLRIPLIDFAHPNIRAQYQQPIVADIFISTSQLCAFLDKVEARVKSHIAVFPLPPGTTKEPQEATPPEELLRSHDDKFKDDQSRAFDRMEAGSSFDGSTPSPGGGATPRVLQPWPARTDEGA